MVQRSHYHCHQIRGSSGVLSGYTPRSKALSPKSAADALYLTCAPPFAAGGGGGCGGGAPCSGAAAAGTSRHGRPPRISASMDARKPYTLEKPACAGGAGPLVPSLHNFGACPLNPILFCGHPVWLSPIVLIAQ